MTPEYQQSLKYAIISLKEGSRLAFVSNLDHKAYELEDSIPILKMPVKQISDFTFIRWASTMDL